MDCLHDDGMNERVDDGMNDLYDQGANGAGCHENRGACGEESLTTFGRKYTHLAMTGNSLDRGSIREGHSITHTCALCV